MKIQYIKFKDNTKTKWLVIILFALIVTYFLIQYFETNSVVASKVDFETSIDNMEFVLGGDACGIKLLATGVLVVEIDNKDIDLNVGDVILKIDDTSINSNSELISYINKESVKGKEITLTVENNGKTRKVTATPVLNVESNNYELGLWVKDSSAGVGMTTFYETTNKYFAALGHGITETSENVILPIQSGAIVKCKIVSINKATPGAPGDIRGTIYKDVYGQIRKNTLNGIYGTIEKMDIVSESETIKAAYKDEIKVGKAEIYCTLENESKKAYEIEIKNVFYDSKTNKNMIIEVTDEELLEETGGIVQGMSGSPIVQDGKLIGAVTHVFLNEPTKGYAVFAGNMIEDMLSITE